MLRRPLLPASAAMPCEAPDTTTGAPSGPACDPEVHQGKATYYAADGSGNCSYDAAPGAPLVAAMNTPDYAASTVC